MIIMLCLVISCYRYRKGSERGQQISKRSESQSSLSFEGVEEEDIQRLENDERKGFDYISGEVKSLCFFLESDCSCASIRFPSYFRDYFS